MNQETQNYEQERKILDSGNRREFASGAVRDIAEGKGRCDLLPLDIIGDYFGYRVPSDCGKYEYIDCILYSIKEFIYTGSLNCIYDAITMFMDNRGWSTITAILEVSKHYEEGAKKYDERNWEKGMPTHCYVDSGIRHLLKYYGKWEDEPHDRAFLWNMFGLLWTIKHHPELNDLPYTKEVLTKEEEKYAENDIQSTEEALKKEGFSVDFDPGICILCPSFAGTCKKCDKGVLVNSKIIDCNKYGSSLDFDPGICVTCPSFAGTYKKCDKGIRVNSKIIDCNKYGM